MPTNKEGVFIRFRVDKELRDRIKIQCILKNITVQDLMEDLARHWLINSEAETQELLDKFEHND